MRKKSVKMVYVAGPYRSKSEFLPKRLFDIAVNIYRARKYAIKVWQSGKVAICPHLNSAFFDFYKIPDDLILPGCIKMMLACDEIHVLPGSENSSGTQEEIKIAKKNGLKVVNVGEVDIFKEWQLELRATNKKI